MFGFSTVKLIGLGVGALMLLGLVLGLKYYKHLADVRGATIATICQATREASGQSKLKCGEVAEQIRFLGEAITAVRTKTAEAKASDAANKVRVEGQQAAINEERGSSYESRIADARARAAERVRRPTPAANPGRGGTASVPGVPAPVGGSAKAASEDGLSDADRLIATEQAIQLDELIKWVKAQHAVDPNGAVMQPH